MFLHHFTQHRYVLEYCVPEVGDSLSIRVHGGGSETSYNALVTCIRNIGGKLSSKETSVGDACCIRSRHSDLGDLKVIMSSFKRNRTLYLRFVYSAGSTYIGLYSFDQSNGKSKSL